MLCIFLKQTHCVFKNKGVAENKASSALLNQAGSYYGVQQKRVKLEGEFKAVRS